MSAGVIILLAAIVLSIVAVRIGAVALELTGLERRVAGFQALSAFTGTGFTTREAEEVVHHPQRRRIVSILILLGNAGLITVIASLVRTFTMSEDALVVMLQIVAVGLVLYLIYQVIIWPRLADRIDRAIKRQLEQRAHLTPAQVQELLLQTEGMGVARVEVPQGCRFAGKTLAETRPRDQGVLILAIERDDKLIPSPKGTDSVQMGDWLVVYGQLDQLPQLIQEQLQPPPEPA